MYASLSFYTFLAASVVAADKLSTYLGDHCTNENLATWSHLTEGKCFEFGQAQSYILRKDTKNTYNLYSGGGCSQYEGQVTLSRTCLSVGDDITGLVNIGPQKKRSFEDHTGNANDRAPFSKRVDGDTYQCPNIPSGADYFFVVEQSSAVHEEIGNRDERLVRTEFMSAFNRAYQNPRGQQHVYSETSYYGENIRDIMVDLRMQSGVIQDIQDRDMESLTESLMYFRDQQRAPIRFVVSLYTGRINHIGGMIARFAWQGD